MKYFDTNTKELSLGQIVETRTENFGEILSLGPLCSIKYFRDGEIYQFYPSSLTIMTKEEMILRILEQ
jgi:hypothetical protein